MPYSCTRSRKGVNYFSIGLWTPCLPFLTELYCLFYVNGIKCIPDSIYDLLTPIVLAHWIQGDGGQEGSGLTLCTDSFTIPDVLRLMNVLIIRYGLDCTILMKQGKYPRIIIRTKSMPLLRSIVGPYMCTSML
jgi:hypothetical protein